MHEPQWRHRNSREEERAAISPNPAVTTSANVWWNGKSFPTLGGVELQSINWRHSRDRELSEFWETALRLTQTREEEGKKNHIHIFFIWLMLPGSHRQKYELTTFWIHNPLEIEPGGANMNGLGGIFFVEPSVKWKCAPTWRLVVTTRNQSTNPPKRSQTTKVKCIKRHVALNLKHVACLVHQFRVQLEGSQQDSSRICYTPEFACQGLPCLNNPTNKKITPDVHSKSRYKRWGSTTGTFPGTQKCSGYYFTRDGLGS